MSCLGCSRTHDESFLVSAAGERDLQAPAVTQLSLPHEQGLLASRVNNIHSNYHTSSDSQHRQRNIRCVPSSTASLDSNCSKRRNCQSFSVEPSALCTPHANERCFITDIENAFGTNDSWGPNNAEPGLEVVQASLLKRVLLVVFAIWNMVLMASNSGSSFVWRRWRSLLRFFVVVTAIVGAPTCVSVLSSRGTNSVVIACAVTAIITIGKFLFDVLAAGTGTWRHGVQSAFWNAVNGAMSMIGAMLN